MQVEVPLRWGDMDAQAHVNNGAFVDYLQEARADLLARFESDGLLGSGLVVVSTQVEYLAPVVVSAEPMLVDITVCHVGGAAVDFGYHLSHAGVPVARARTRLCPFEFQTNKIRRLSAAERKFLADWAGPCPELRDLPAVPVDEHALAAPLRVRWSDLDSYGHVNNVEFFNYLQEARFALLAAAAPEVDDAEPTLLLVVRQDVDYRSQLSFRTRPYQIATGVASIGRTSLTLSSQVRDPDTGAVFATGATVLVTADVTGKPTPIRPAWVESLQRFRLAGAND